MATTVADRVSEVLDHLGIERAHLAASMLADLAEFARTQPQRYCIAHACLSAASR